MNRQFEPLINDQELLVKQFKTEATDKAVSKLSKKIGADTIIEKFAKAEKMLGRIRNPEKSLIKSQLAYYYLLMGMIESQRKVGKAETLLKKALNTGLRMDQDKALAKLNLAGIALTKRRKKEAQILLTEVKRLDSKNVLAEQTKYIKQQMKRI